MALPQMSLAVVGVDFPNRRGPTRRFELAMCIPGELIELRPEPNNPADPLAIAVFSARGIQIGYIRAERAQRIGQLINAARLEAAIFQETTEWGAVIRASFDGEAPELPAIEPKIRTEEPEFWPDEIPTDE